MRALAQLDAALAVGRRELAAYTGDDPDSVFSLVEEREGFILSALAAMTSAEAEDQSLLISKLRLILDQQRELAHAASSLRDEVMQSINESRFQSQRLAGYGRAVRPNVIAPAFARS